MPSDPLIGRHLGNYLIERLLGRGGMAVVYYGWDKALARPVAIKVIDARYRDDPTYAMRFIREARTVARWQHENIVKVFYAGEEEGLYYFVMEYLSGKDLGKWMGKLAHQDGLPQAEILRIGRAVAQALDYAHAQGVIHRDVKPGNILLTEDGRVVLTDFGLAMDVAQGSVGEAFGSAHYIAPEQAKRSSDAVPQSDLYSFGVVLFEMLTGRVPFDDPSPTSVALQHITQNVPSPRAFNPMLGPEVEQFLLKALSKQPEDRFPTGQAMMTALADALQNPIGGVQRPITLPPPPARAGNLPEPAGGAGPRAESVPEPGNAAPSDLLGLQFDEYRLEMLLGQGGMARVYRGVDTKLQRYAAIKVIDTPFRADAEYVMRFEREARAIAQLEHPHIVRLYRYGEAHGLLYMAMQYVEGADLGAVMAAYRREKSWMPLEEAGRIVTQVCAALDYMHGKGVIHRDLKPSNVMLDQRGEAYLTDFGLSLLTETGTRGEIFGTPHYMAPEQAISSANAGPGSDLYALGVIVYEMLTGRVPFDQGEPLEIAMQHVKEATPAPRSFRREISPEMEAVILKALEKKPQDRYPSGAAFAAAFAQAQPAAGVVAEPPEKVVSPALSVASPGEAGPPSVSVAPSTSVPEQVARQLAEPPAAQRPERKRRKFSLARVFFGVVLLAVLILGGWFMFVDRRIPLFGMGNPALPAPSMTVPASTPTVTPTYPPSKTVPPSPTETLEPSPTNTEAPTLTASPTPSLTPTLSPTPPLPDTPTLPSAPSLTPSPLPLITSSPTPLPLIIFTREMDEMPVVQIPGGMFLMGANPDDAFARADERPQHPVTLDSFSLDQYEVSVAQYATFLTQNGGHAPSACQGFTCVRTNFEALDSHLVWNGGALYEAEPGYENHPINYVTWYGARAYCEWVGGRLPTEAEWEYAARGSDGRRYPWGDEVPDATKALFEGVFAALQPVDAFVDGISFFGIYGMAGSLWEWVGDWYAADFYANSPDTNPTGPVPGAFRDPRALRGGGWDSLPEDVRATARHFADPLNGGGLGGNVGFRCAMGGGE